MTNFPENISSLLALFRPQSEFTKNNDLGISLLKYAVEEGTNMFNRIEDYREMLTRSDYDRFVIRYRKKSNDNEIVSCSPMLILWIKSTQNTSMNPDLAKNTITFKGRYKRIKGVRIQDGICRETGFRFRKYELINQEPLAQGTSGCGGMQGPLAQATSGQPYGGVQDPLVQGTCGQPYGGMQDPLMQATYAQPYGGVQDHLARATSGQPYGGGSNDLERLLTSSIPERDFLMNDDDSDFMLEEVGPDMDFNGFDFDKAYYDYLNYQRALDSKKTIIDDNDDDYGDDDDSNNDIENKFHYLSCEI